MTRAEIEAAFHNFIQLEVSTGGPDPQVQLAADWTRLDKTESVLESSWRVGCFVGPYTLGAAAGIWSAISPYSSERTIAQQLEKNWVGIPVRRERRACWRPDKLARCLKSWFKWTCEKLVNLETASYDELYRSMSSDVMFFGRYASMKACETLYRAGLVTASQGDIRPSGARFPRKTLAAITGHDELIDGNSKSKLEHVNWWAEEVKARVPQELSWFAFETLLCNFRQALSGKYPGRSHDRELAHFLKAEAYWGDLEQTMPFRLLRACIFPQACLGEINGWAGARKELESVWANYGYFWCDTVCSYANTTDLARPVRRAA